MKYSLLVQGLGEVLSSIIHVYYLAGAYYALKWELPEGSLLGRQRSPPVVTEGKECINSRDVFLSLSINLGDPSLISCRERERRKVAGSSCMLVPLNATILCIHSSQECTGSMGIKTYTQQEESVEVIS